MDNQLTDAKSLLNIQNTTIATHKKVLTNKKTLKPALQDLVMVEKDRYPLVDEDGGGMKENFMI